MIEIDLKEYLVEHLNACKKDGMQKTTFVIVSDRNIHYIIDVCHEYHLAYEFGICNQFKKITIDLSNFTYVER